MIEKQLYEFNAVSEQSQMAVYNLQGEKMGEYFIEAKRTTVDLSSLPAGMFNLVFSSQNVSYSPVKFIKE
ncbi:T9SS type A sorting domain-containing protein [Cytophaga aurantiaca]|uniref:T9SS type A sorting domain-containing protein n=1 Tax=Cytophaga aurantiaca TaxID=29530 RepID=UPI000372EC27|nr:T9SS type A sorting domain-containing protein [Cytophaga aurantiaca]